MTRTISAPLPNPTSKIDPGWTSFDTWLKEHNVPFQQDPAVRRYQGSNEVSLRYQDDQSLNHALNLRAYGLGSRYAELAENDFGNEFDDEHVLSDQTLEAIFKKEALRFSAGSKVFKGVGLKAFYQVHGFNGIEVGAEVQFHGYLSTSVCMENAILFAKGAGQVLVISGMDRWDAIVPLNTEIRHSNAGTRPEHEILLFKGCRMKVIGIEEVRPGFNRRIHLEILVP